MAIEPRGPIAGLVLAGGEGRRLGGAKALMNLGGKPLVQHAIDRLAPQVATLWLSARGNPGALADLGPEIVPDDAPMARGPLAGIAAGLRRAASTGHALLAVVPCDAPFLPDDLVSLLEAGLGQAPLAVVAGDRLHPTFSLWRTTTRAAVETALETGQLRLGAVCRELGAALVHPSAHWSGTALFNVNSREDLLEASESYRERNDATDNRGS